MKMAHAPFWESRQELRMHRMHPELRLCDHHDTRRCLSHPLPMSDSPASSSPSTYPKLMQLSLLQWRIKNRRVIPSPDAAIVVHCSHSYSVSPPTAASPSLFSTRAWQQWVQFAALGLLPLMTSQSHAEETLCMQARNATVSKTLITPTPNTTHTNPQSSWGDIMR